jgi:hypothetical protein
MNSTSDLEPEALPDWVAGAEPLARRALQQIADDEQIGSLQSAEPVEDDVFLLRFAADVHGYPGWAWTAAVAQVEGGAPTVLEVELLPGDGALVPPRWVPWSQRFAEFRERREADLRSRRAARTARERRGDRRDEAETGAPAEPDSPRADADGILADDSSDAEPNSQDQE